MNLVHLMEWKLYDCCAVVYCNNNNNKIIIIIITSLLKEDNIFSERINLKYGPRKNVIK